MPANVKGKIDNFLITRLLGSGLTAKVFHAYNPANGEECALKVLNTSDPRKKLATLESFHNEIAAASQMDHKHIVKYLKHKTNETLVSKKGTMVKAPYMTQELCPSGELHDYID